MKLEPLHDNVWVQPDDKEERSKGGIIMPDTAQIRPARGRVLAVGPGKLLENGTRVPVGVDVGDTVYYGKYAGNKVDVEGEELLVVPESGLLAKGVP